MLTKLLRRESTVRQMLWIDGILGLGMCAGIALVLCSEAFRREFSQLLGRWPRLRNIAERVLHPMASYGKARSALIGALALSFGATALALHTANPGDGSWKLCLVAPIGHLVNSLPLTPGGIGVGETAFNALFALTRMRGGADALLCLRIWSLLVGALGLLNYIFRMGRIVHWQKDHPGADQVAS